MELAFGASSWPYNLICELTYSRQWKKSLIVNVCKRIEWPFKEKDLLLNFEVVKFSYAVNAIYHFAIQRF